MKEDKVKTIRIPLIAREISCGVCIYERVREDEYRVLLVKEKNWHTRRPHKNWSFPKGHIEQGESFFDCARREAWEETGLDVVLEDKLPSVFTPKKDVHFWLARAATSVEPTTDNSSGEITQVKWFQLTEELPVHVYQRPLVKHLIELFDEREDNDSVTYELLELMRFVKAYAEDADWLTLKKELTKMCHPRIRKKFSRRHPLTKAQQPNEFERKVAKIWCEMTGKVVSPT